MIQPVNNSDSFYPRYRDGAIFVVVTVISAVIVNMLTDTSRWDHVFDFRLLWLAGRTWLLGYSPYTSSFDAIYAMTFGGGQSSWHVFNYPPNFALVAIPMACLPYAVAAKVWLVINISCVTLSAAVISRTVASQAGWRRTLVFVSVVIFTLSHYAGGYSLFYGQTSFLVLLGASCLVYGIAREATLPLCVALILLSLKPNVGIFAGLLVCAHIYNVNTRSWQSWALWPSVVAVVFVIVGTAPAVAIGGFENTVGGFAERLGAYSASEPSAVYSLTGLPYLLDTFADLTISLPVSLLFGAITCVLLAYTAQTREFAAFSVLAASFFFVPLHTYDLVATVVLIPLLWRLTAPRAALAALALVTISRCDMFGLQVNPKSWFDDGLLPATLGLLILVLVCVRATTRTTDSMHPIKKSDRKSSRAEST